MRREDSRSVSTVRRGRGSLIGVHHAAPLRTSRLKALRTTHLKHRKSLARGAGQRFHGRAAFVTIDSYGITAKLPKLTHPSTANQQPLRNRMPCERPMRKAGSKLMERGSGTNEEDKIVSEVDIMIRKQARMTLKALLGRLKECSVFDLLVINMEIQALAICHPTLFEVTRKCSYVPLHEVVMARNATLETIKEVYEANPRAIGFKPPNGRLPLHEACYNGATWEVVEFLYKKFPGAAMMKDPYRYGQTPLHVACSAFRREIEVVESSWTERRDVLGYLLQECPEAARQKDNRGRLPLHLLLSNHRDAALGPISEPEDAMLLLGVVQAFPSAASVKDNLGNLPLQKALQGSISCEGLFCFEGFLTICELLAANPQAVLKIGQVNFCDLPWATRLLLFGYHLAQTTGLPISYSICFPLHATLLQRCSRYSYARLYDEAIGMCDTHFNRLDSYGRLPLHLAIARLAATRKERLDRKTLPITVRQVLKTFELEPRAALVRDVSVSGDRMYPFMMAAAACVPRVRPSGDEKAPEWLDLIYRLLRVMDPQQLFSDRGTLRHGNK